MGSHHAVPPSLVWLIATAIVILATLWPQYSGNSGRTAGLPAANARIVESLAEQVGVSAFSLSDAARRRLPVLIPGFGAQRSACNESFMRILTRITCEAAADDAGADTTGGDGGDRGSGDRGSGEPSSIGVLRLGTLRYGDRKELFPRWQCVCPMGAVAVAGESTAAESVFVYRSAEKPWSGLLLNLAREARDEANTPIETRREAVSMRGMEGLLRNEVRWGQSSLPGCPLECARGARRAHGADGNDRDDRDDRASDDHDAGGSGLGSGFVSRIHH